MTPMETSTLQIISYSLGSVVATLTIMGLVVRFVLVPYLRVTLIEPVAQINTQVSVNGNRSENPTILDMLHDVQMETRATGMEVVVMSRMFDGHLEHAESKDRQLDALERRVRKIEVQRRDKR